jgi:hypothetical protein
VIAALGRLLAPYALKLLAWGAIALSVIGALLSVKRMIERGAIAAERANNQARTIERVEHVREVEDRVSRLPEPDARDRLREWNRD